MLLLQISVSLISNSEVDLTPACIFNTLHFIRTRKHVSHGCCHVRLFQKYCEYMNVTVFSVQYNFLEYFSPYGMSDQKLKLRGHFLELAVTL